MHKTDETCIPQEVNRNRRTDNIIVGRTLRDILYTLQDKQKAGGRIQELEMEYNRVLIELRQMGCDAEIIEPREEEITTLPQQKDREYRPHGINLQYKGKIQILEKLYIEIFAEKELIING